MDDLSFRRRLFADPRDSDKDINEVCASDKSKAQFRDELISFNDKLEQAFNIDVPDNLADRILLGQNLTSKNKQKKFRRRYLAIAASVFAAFSLTLSVMQTRSTSDLVAHAIAHMQSELDHIPQNSSYSLSELNEKLASFGGVIAENLGNIKFVSFCTFEGTRSLHIVMTDQGKEVTVFVVPKTSGLTAQRSLERGIFNGASVSGQNADLVVISANESTTQTWKQRLSNGIKWQKA